MTADTVSEHVLQGKLQDSWRLSGSDLAERIAIQSDRLILTGRNVGSGYRSADSHRYEAIRHVERFGSNFEPLHFVNIESA